MTERRMGCRLAGVVVGLSLLAAAWAPAAESQRPRPQTAAELLPPRPPAEENAAPLLMEAIAALEAEDVWDTTLAALAVEAYSAGYSATGSRNLVALVEALHIPAAGNRSPTVDEVCEELAQRLAGPAARRALALCTQAAARPRCWFDLDYSQGPNLQLPHLAKLRNLARFLAAASQVLAERGDTTTAWACIGQQLRLADLLREEPLLITQLVRIAILKIALATLQDVAALAPPEALTCQQLDALLDRLDDGAPMAAALDGERLLLGEWIFAQPPEKVGELLKTLGNVNDAPALTAPQLAAERAAGAAALVRLADLASRPYFSVKDELAAAADPAKFAATVVVKAVLPALFPACGKAADCQAGLRVTRIGLRLKAQRNVQGAYPADLGSLQAADIPLDKALDPFTGKALCYRLEGQGFVLYSVGLDGTDNGGTPRQGDAKQGFDIVWRVTR